MQTHEDMSHQNNFINELRRRAKESIEKGDGKITAGSSGEKPIAKWEHNGMQVVIRPDDPQGILRISIGGGVEIVPLNYCTIRGDIGKCIALLELAIAALKAGA